MKAAAEPHRHLTLAIPAHLHHRGLVAHERAVARVRQRDEGAVAGIVDARHVVGDAAAVADKLAPPEKYVDPRRADMKDILNLKIKRRESFRPFAPSILREAVGEWFEVDDDVPFMMQVYQIREEKRAQIPAVTHVNGSGRLQSVTEEQNRRYYGLIEAFRVRSAAGFALAVQWHPEWQVLKNPFSLAMFAAFGDAARARINARK